jgi:hypothetical protein
MPFGAALGVGVSVCGGICILVAAAWLQEGTDKLPSAAYFVLLQAGSCTGGTCLCLLWPVGCLSVGVHKVQQCASAGKGGVK